MSSQPLIKDLYRAIRPELEEVEREIKASLSTPLGAVAEMIDHLGGYGGKRLRPALVLLLMQAAGADSPGPRGIRLGAVVEMIHLATLVHDDVIDEAAMRRRQDTVNSRWTNYDAVLLGDIVFSRSINLLGRLGDQRSLLTLTSTVSTLCEGEILQNSHRRDADLSEETYYAIIEAKTACLYGAGCELAAHLASAPAATVEAFRKFGLELGRGFQIVDDCLDITGVEEVVGKSLGTDMRLGKMTLPLILLRESCTPDERKLLEEVVTSPEPHPKETARLKEILRRYEAFERALERAREHSDNAVGAVRPHVSPKSLAALETVASFVFTRRV
jgi:octaprenyl-diphosphate synthase